MARVLVASSVVFHKVIVFTIAAFKDREATYMASNNIKSVGKSIGVKVSPILFASIVKTTPISTVPRKILRFHILHEINRAVELTR